MATNHYANAESVRLDEYITPDRCRTVLPDMLGVPGGVTEVPVEFNLSEAFLQSLPDGLSADGVTVYGFVRLNAALRARFGEAVEKDRAKCRITFGDWENRFLFLCETGQREVAAFVTPAEVRHLLENCLHAVPVAAQ